MSGKNDKKIRKEIRGAGADIYEEVKRQVNALPWRQRWTIARKIRRGKW